MKKFDIGVVGGGHAGVEAVHIASQFDLSIALFSLEGVSLASCPCNPAVGGVGKGQVVREIDCLGGLMGRVADLAGIQFRTLNESKGHAVHSTRVQVDKMQYSLEATKLLEQVENVTIIRKEVSKIYFESGIWHVLSGEEEYLLSSVIITAGTFLNGVLHCGEKKNRGGRVSAKASAGLQEMFTGSGFSKARFKTGTPPRLKASTIDFSKCTPQESDPGTINFHLFSDPFERNLSQKTCYLTRTTASTIETIVKNRERSPLFNGQIEGIGPRYCPSIEDKAFRYPDRSQHHIFLEPETENGETIYPSGISTSLPSEIQHEIINSITGLENAEIDIYGYAVEYDVIDPTSLWPTLEHKIFERLYFAGQINGTSGYEEAAGQGLVAGINAALRILGRESLVLDHKESYIGQMISDLVNTKRDEPYRLFTSRSDYRLFIREDNTFLRMYSYRKLLNLDKSHDKKLDLLIREYQILKEMVFSDQNLVQKLKSPNTDPVEVLKNWLTSISFSYSVVRAVAVEFKYEGYIHRADDIKSGISKLDLRKIKWDELIKDPAISNECRQRIEKSKPLNFEQLRKISGIRPSTIQLVACRL